MKIKTRLVICLTISIFSGLGLLAGIFSNSFEVAVWGGFGALVWTVLFHIHWYDNKIENIEQRIGVLEAD